MKVYLGGKVSFDFIFREGDLGLITTSQKQLDKYSFASVTGRSGSTKVTIRVSSWKIMNVYF